MLGFTPRAADADRYAATSPVAALLSRDCVAMCTFHLTDAALPFVAAFLAATGVGSCATLPSSLTGAVLRDAARRRYVFVVKEASMAVTKRRASWLSFLLAGFASLLASSLCVFGVVTVYAFGLALQADARFLPNSA